jgi:hypothetical protein
VLDSHCCNHALFSQTGMVYFLEFTVISKVFCTHYIDHGCTTMGSNNGTRGLIVVKMLHAGIQRYMDRPIKCSSVKPECEEPIKGSC